MCVFGVWVVRATRVFDVFSCVATYFGCVGLSGCFGVLCLVLRLYCVWFRGFLLCGLVWGWFGGLELLLFLVAAVGFVLSLGFLGFQLWFLV